MTDTDTIPAEAQVECACGSKLFKLPTDPQPDDVISCGRCGREWRYADMKSVAIDKTMDAVKQLLRDALKLK